MGVTSVGWERRAVRPGQNYMPLWLPGRWVAEHVIGSPQRSLMHVKHLRTVCRSCHSTLRQRRPTCNCQAAACIHRASGGSKRAPRRSGGADAGCAVGGWRRSNQQRQAGQQARQPACHGGGAVCLHMQHVGGGGGGAGLGPRRPGGSSRLCHALQCRFAYDPDRRCKQQSSLDKAPARRRAHPAPKPERSPTRVAAQAADVNYGMAGGQAVWKENVRFSVCVQGELGAFCSTSQVYRISLNALERRRAVSHIVPAAWHPTPDGSCGSSCPHPALRPHAQGSNRCTFNFSEGGRREGGRAGAGAAGSCRSHRSGLRDAVLLSQLRHGHSTVDVCLGGCRGGLMHLLTFTQADHQAAAGSGAFCSARGKGAAAPVQRRGRRLACGSRAGDRRLLSAFSGVLIHAWSQCQGQARGVL